MERCLCVARYALLPEFLWHSNPADKAPAPVKIPIRAMLEQLEKRGVGYNCLELADTGMKDKPL